MKANQVTKSCVEKEYHVNRAELPISCPLPSMILWNAHPKVYLPIEATGRAKCPYCGAAYVLTDFDGQDGH